MTESRIPNESPIGTDGVCVLGGVALDYATGDQTPTSGGVPFVGRGIYLSGVAGPATLVIMHQSGEVLTYANLVRGVAHPFSVKKIIQAGSTAGLVGNILR